MPAERRVPPGVVEVPVPGGVQPVEPRQVADAQRAFSLPFGPIMAIRVPRDAPSLTLDMVQATTALDPVNAGNYQISLAISGAPSAPPQAVGGYAVSLWLSAGGLDLLALGSQPVIGGVLNWSTSQPLNGAAAPPPVTLIVQLADPVGREGPLLQVPIGA